MHNYLSARLYYLIMIKCPLETSIVNQHTLIQKILKMIRMAVQKRTKDVKLSKNVGGYEL